MPNHEVKNMSASTEVRKFEHGKIELVDIAEHTVARFVLQKGWKWSNEVKPIVKTEWCEAPHLQYEISGRYHVKMKDGTEFEIGPGDVSFIPPQDMMHGSSGMNPRWASSLWAQELPLD